MKTETKKCRKVNVLTDAKVVIEPQPHVTRWYDKPENIAKALEQWAREIHDFFRDHRSMDVNSVYVERVHEDQCSECKRAWEPADDEDGTPPYCAYCGAIIEEQAA